MAELPVLKNGSTGEAVKGLKNALEARLGNHGFFDRPLNDAFGPKVDQAVKDFQRKAGLGVDGQVGPKTWGALRVHLVQPGDTLSGIAQQTLGNGDRWPEIHKLNSELVSDPNLIFPGQVFVLP
ncbi:MAG: peptidoglycan-binding protein [Actinobacteria bacterium]|nr:peptidoglycan-binding protein [Actinomycetota bacterium]